MVYLIYSLEGTFTGYIASTQDKAQAKCDYLVSLKPHMSYVYERVTLDQ